jgi:hypothetical protein
MVIPWDFSEVYCRYIAGEALTVSQQLIDKKKYIYNFCIKWYNSGGYFLMQANFFNLKPQGHQI